MRRRDAGSIQERSKGRWEIRVELGRGPDGERKRKIVQFRGNKTEANRKLRELLTSLDIGIPLSTKKITFGQWLSKWMDEYVIPNKRQKTIERYEGLIKKHIAPVLGRIELTKLTPSEIRTLEAGLTAKGMAPKGVQLVHNVTSLKSSGVDIVVAMLPSSLRRRCPLHGRAEWSACLLPR